MAIKEGDKLPAAKFNMMKDGKPAAVTTDELFAGKKVVVFAVPGAFTPTCSMAHLPGFVVNADKIKAKGVDSIICLSVNDAFVMDAWGKYEECRTSADGRRRQRRLHESASASKWTAAASVSASVRSATR